MHGIELTEIVALDLLPTNHLYFVDFDIVADKKNAHTHSRNKIK